MLGQLEIETVLFSLLHYNFNKSVMDTINAQRKHELDSGASLASHWDPLQMLFRSYLSCVSSHPDTRPQATGLPNTCTPNTVNAH